MTDRLDRNERLLRLAFGIARNGTCDRARHGCVIAKDGVVLSTGYNGSTDGAEHCDDVGHDLWRWTPGEWLREIDGNGNQVLGWNEEGAEIHCLRTLHAEQNAILNAAISGVSVADADWYVTGIPCRRCMKMIVRTRPRSLHCWDQDLQDWDARMISAIEIWEDRKPGDARYFIQYDRETLRLQNIMDEDWK